MAEITPFSNGEFALSVIPDGDTFKVRAPELARALGFAEARDLLRSIPEGEKGSELSPTLGGEQRIGYLTEPGFYRALGQRQAARITDPDIRAQVERFQSWVYGDVLPSIRKHGGYLSPTATEDQIDGIIRRATAQAHGLQALKGIIHADHLEAKGRIVLARMLGEQPELDPASRPLYAQDYLKEKKGLSSSEMRKIAGVFGKRVKAAYVLERGCDPERYDLNLSNGQVKQVNAYTEADRPLMDRVRNEHYAGGAA